MLTHPEGLQRDRAPSWGKTPKMCTGTVDVAAGGTQSQQVCEDSLLAGAVHTKAAWDRRPGASGFGGSEAG